MTIVDGFSRDALSIEVGNRLRTEHVGAALDRIMTTAGRKSKYLFIDNGSEFHGKALSRACQEFGIELTTGHRADRTSAATSNDWSEPS